MRDFKRDMKGGGPIVSLNEPPIVTEENRGSMCFAPAKGFAWNPLIKIERNRPCPCGSGKKFKLCHLPEMPRIIPEEMAKEYHAAMRTVALIKFTDKPREGVEDAVPKVHL